jgi:hypothetical protein
VAFTYTAGSTADRDRLRFEIGDTDIDRALFDNEELDDLLVQDTAVLAAAAHACEILAVRFSRDFDFTADGHTFRKSTIATMYAKMAARLRARALGTSVVVPRRIDGYSDDIDSDEVAVNSGAGFDRGSFE